MSDDRKDTGEHSRPGRKVKPLGHAEAVCYKTPRPPGSLVDHARHAITVNPANRPQMQLAPGMQLPSEAFVAVMTNRYWGSDGVDLTVGFLDTPPLDLRRKILAHMNAWGAFANVRFRETADSAQVRISRGGGGYWSYLGTDILHETDPAKPTMNLQGFTMETPDSEFYRVVRHETGHTLGCPHEHMRADLVSLIDPDKAIEYFERNEGWSAEMTRAQVLTPLDPATIRGTARSDAHSIMCYQIPGAITRNGKPILGGTDIDQSDRDFIKLIYPKPAEAPGRATSGDHAAPETPRAGEAAKEGAHAGEAATEPKRSAQEGMVEFRIQPGLKVLASAPVERKTLEQLVRLLG